MPSPLPWTSPVDAAALTRELVAGGLPLLGLTVEPTQVVLRRTTGAFTAGELTTAQTVLTAHNVAALQAAEAATQALRRAERNKNPLTLTLPDRVRRLEILMGAE